MKKLTSEVPQARATYTYNAERVIGNGSFGIVYQALVVETGETVAIKKVYQDKRYKNRELQIMRELKHPNIVELKHAFYTSGDRPDELFLNVVMEYISDTVKRVLNFYTRSAASMPLIYVKLYIFQLARALAYCHVDNICHRDVKPQNLLVDGRTHVLKLCDFGSAKRLVPGESNVAYICSRYYRAPELILGSNQYTTAVDTWSLGCVMGELLQGAPLFPGNSGVDQLMEIVRVLGTPTVDELKAMHAPYENARFPIIKPIEWAKILHSRNCPEAVDLISKVLVFNPAARSTPIEILAHPFFDELRDVDARLPCGRPIPPLLFDLTSSEKRAAAACGENLLQKIIPAWYTVKQSE
eukprot:GDKJ01027510.1.p1 GENE.GDKJ01027510.1~~GDKJ01027510.1.p1  ORF type:complete len:394 (-),score=57.88 GDKJ01027510.1:132-1196(-)